MRPMISTSYRKVTRHVLLLRRAPGVRRAAPITRLGLYMVAAMEGCLAAK
jgi:hypothetical protein